MIVDADSASGVADKPIDLNDQWALAQKGVTGRTVGDKLYFDYTICRTKRGCR